VAAFSPIAAVIFDVGGVLIEVRSEDIPRQWAAASGADPAAVDRIYGSDTDYRRLERGEITLAQYHAHIVARIGRPMSYEQFTRGWCDVFGRVLPGVEALLSGLDDGLRLICLSNTNAWHAEIWRAKYAEMLGRFERVFVSYEMGSRKPEPACYQAVIDYLALSPEQIVFIDDKPKNVAAARLLGMQGVVAVDAEQIARDLDRLGVKLGV